MSSSQSTSAVSISGLTKSFGHSAPVLRGIDLEVQPGECVVFLGPSGCGKTTLLRCIAGLEDPTEGRILFNGTDLTKDQPQHRPVGLVFQDFALYPHKRVRDNIGLGLRVGGLPKEEAQQRVTEVARLLQIDHLLDRFPRELSGGQKQRVGIGRALAKEPKVLLMDEPLSNLDAKLRYEMRNEIESLRDRLTETAIIYVTHDQSEAMSLADRIIVMNKGVIAQEGSGRDIYLSPADRFVADFIGSPPISFLTLSDDQVLGLRPEAVHLGHPVGTEKLGAGHLIGSEHFGHEILARYRTAYGELTVRLSADIEHIPDETPISYTPHLALWFDQLGNRAISLQDALVLRS